MKAVSQILEQQGYLTPSNLSLLNAYQEKWQVNDFQAILETNLLTESELAERLADHFGLPKLAGIDDDLVETEALTNISYQDARTYGVFPYRFIGEDGLSIVLFDPTQDQSLDFLNATFDRFRLAIAERSLVNQAIDNHFPILDQIPSLKKLKGRHES